MHRVNCSTPQPWRIAHATPATGVRDVPWAWGDASPPHLTRISALSQVVCVSGARVLTRRRRPGAG